MPEHYAQTPADRYPENSVRPAHPDARFALIRQSSVTPRQRKARADLDEDIVGSQYRSEIFCTTPEQRRASEEMITDVDASGHWPGKTVTRLSERTAFWEMGPKDQGYLLRFPHGCKPSFPRQNHTSHD